MIQNRLLCPQNTAVFHKISSCVGKQRAVSLRMILDELAQLEAEIQAGMAELREMLS